MARPSQPLLWELDADDQPSSAVVSSEIVDELEVVQAQRDEHPDVFESIDDCRDRELAADGADGNEQSWLGGEANGSDVDAQPRLFENDKAWVEEWKSMPSFAQRDLSPHQSICVHFESDEDRLAFAALVGQTVTSRTRSIWYPKAEIVRLIDKRFVSAQPVAPRYPVYVVSKGRWESRLTVKALERMGVPYRIVIEPQEFERYATAISAENIIALPFSNLGQGSIPARNFIWEHAIASGATRHWILDDNIDGFYRLYQNLKVPVTTGAIFRAAEDFTDRYANVALSGFNYFMFASRKTVLPPFTLNTRIYSCILIRNDIEYRWRGRYNEDTDLAIRVLKDGHCTILFNAFLAMKATTMTMAGGNTDELYGGDGRLKMAESLREQHPDCVIVTEKWGRPQHHVDYRRFRTNKLIPKLGTSRADVVDEFGMRLERIDA